MKVLTTGALVVFLAGCHDFDVDFQAYCARNPSACGGADGGDAGRLDAGADAGGGDLDAGDDGGFGGGRGDGGQDAGLDGGRDAGVFDAGAPLPAALKTYALSPDFVVYSADVGLSGVVVAGVRGIDAGQPPNDRDAALARLGPSLVEAEFVGGAANDQFFGVSVRGDEFFAAGLTRSFLGSSSQDQSFLVSGSIRSGITTTRRLREQRNAAVNARVSAPADGGWLVAGAVSTGDTGLVVRLTSGLNVSSAMSFSFASATNLTVRSVISVGANVVVVGTFFDGFANVGFVSSFNGPGLTPGFAAKVSSFDIGTRVVLLDAVTDGNSLVAVGLDGSAGLLLRFDLTSGGLTSSFTSTELTFRGVLGPAPLHVAGLHQGSVAVARVEGTNLAGVRFPPLVWSSPLSRQPLAWQGGLRVLGLNGAALVDMPLNADLYANCDGTRVGQAFLAPLTPSQATVTALATVGTSVALVDDAVAPTRWLVSAQSVAACF